MSSGLPVLSPAMQPEKPSWPEMQMHLAKVLRAVTLAAAASATTVSYDPGYDDAGRLLTDVACSDGVNGLITRYKWTTQGAVTGFPHIGGAQGVGWNSPNCGTCWSATYEGKTVYMLAVDKADNGLNMAEAAMNELTNGQAKSKGRVDATVALVEPRNCGLQ